LIKPYGDAGLRVHACLATVAGSIGLVALVAPPWLTAACLVVVVRAVQAPVAGYESGVYALSDWQRAEGALINSGSALGFFLGGSFAGWVFTATADAGAVALASLAAFAACLVVTWRLWPHAARGDR
jgi:hypothetical protein